MAGNKYQPKAGGIGNFKPPKPDVSTERSRVKHEAQLTRKLRRRHWRKKKHGRQ